MRRVATMLVVAAAFVGLTVLPAAADAPVEFSFSATDTDVDPCTGEHMTVNLLFNVKAHEHGNNTVLIIDAHGETSNGYVGEGHETAVTNQNHWISVFNWQVTNDETGARFIIKGRFKIDLETGGAQMDSVELTCTG